MQPPKIREAPASADRPGGGAITQVEAAKQLKVGVATIKRAELEPQKPLGPAIADALPVVKQKSKDDAK